MRHIRPITPVRASAFGDYMGAWGAFMDALNRAFAQYFEDKKAELGF